MGEKLTTLENCDVKIMALHYYEQKLDICYIYKKINYCSNTTKP